MCHVTNQSRIKSGSLLLNVHIFFCNISGADVDTVYWQLSGVWTHSWENMAALQSVYSACARQESGELWYVCELIGYELLVDVTDFIIVFCCVSDY